MIQDPTFHTVLYSRGWDVFELSVCSRRRGMQLSSRSRVQGGGDDVQPHIHPYLSSRRWDAIELPLDSRGQGGAMS